MSRIRIGLDCDGVVCDFWGAYVKRYGVEDTNTINSRCFNELKKDSSFWENLPLLNTPNFKVTLWCTKRVNPKAYTRAWMKRNGFDGIPIRQLSNPKATKYEYICNDVDVFIDDSVENFVSINRSGLPCLLMDHQLNRTFDTPYRLFNLDYHEIKELYGQLLREGHKISPNYRVGDHY